MQSSNTKINSTLNENENKNNKRKTEDAFDELENILFDKKKDAFDELELFLFAEPEKQKVEANDIIEIPQEFSFGMSLSSQLIFSLRLKEKDFYSVRANSIEASLECARINSNLIIYPIKFEHPRKTVTVNVNALSFYNFLQKYANDPTIMKFIKYDKNKMLKISKSKLEGEAVTVRHGM